MHDRGLSAGQYGLALSAAGAGAFLGTMLALRLSSFLGFGHAFAACLVLSTGAPLLLAALPWRGSSLVSGLAAIEFVGGVGLGCANVLSVTLRQIVVPTGSLARSNGGYRLLIFGAIPFGSALAGLIGAHAGARTGVLIGALGLAVSGVPMYLRRIRTLPTAESARPAAPSTGPRNAAPAIASVE
ncbi:MAG: MFS transporter [Streptosporangiaceae bacterium]